MCYPSVGQDKSFDVYPSLFYPHTPSFPQSWKKKTILHKKIEPLAFSNDITEIAEVQLSPEGVPILSGAESMGVFLNLPEVLNISSSSSEGEHNNTPKKRKFSKKNDKSARIRSPLLGKEGISKKTKPIKKLQPVLKKYNTIKSDTSTEPPIVRKRGRPRKYPIPTSNVADIIQKNIKPILSTNNPIDQKVKEKDIKLTCSECNALFSDKNNLKRHIRKIHQGKTALIAKDRSSFEDPKDKILIAWTPVDKTLCSVFSLEYIYRVKLRESNSFTYSSRITHEIIYFTDPVVTGYNGYVASANKSIMNIPSSNMQYTVSELQYIPLAYQPISLTSPLQYDTNALYRVRINSHTPELSGWYFSTEISQSSLFIHLSTLQPYYARVDSNNKCIVKTISTPHNEYVVDKIEKIYCLWKSENMQVNSTFEFDKVYKVSLVSKSTRICYISKRVCDKTVSLCISNRNFLGEIVNSDKNKIIPKCINTSSDPLPISKMESIYSHWIRVYTNETYNNNSLYRVNVRGNDGYLTYVLITTISLYELSLTPELYEFLPATQQELIGQIASPQLFQSTNKTCCIERLNFHWNKVDITDKRREFSLWKLYRVIPFNHTNQSPNRSILCTVISSHTLHFPDPYNKNNIGVVSISSKNIYGSTPRGPSSSSISVSYPLTAVDEISTSWSILPINYQCEFDVGYLYMAHIDLNGKSLSLLSLYVTPDLLLFDSPNEILSIGKLYYSNKSHIIYTDTSRPHDKDSNKLFSVVSLRYLTGVIET
ncbi:hypothetical protein LOD99_13052 [Oopsacas minuta]|uniref:C2H2-type domain-containing protein n=1 Tax=Oopsacas minuta TaxID=111878 RepID=A0AAV7JAQ8_9METZ|nr:hypothetical protein LOD99_13052 [Oopsacas minuta]